MNDLEFIDHLLDKSSDLLRKAFGGHNNARKKGDLSLVTDADLACEAYLLEQIRNHYPEDAIISEESGAWRVNRKMGQFVWIIDPLDGTTNFANAYPFFGTSIARACFNKDDRIEVLTGGISEPMNGKKYLAALNQGAFCNGKQLRCHSIRPLSEAFLVTGFYYMKGSDLRNDIRSFENIAQVCQSIRRDGSAALDLAYVAAGIYDAFWERGLSLWDMAAGSLLVQEAGGWVKNYPTETSASLEKAFNTLDYNLEGEGIIAGSIGAVKSISTLLYQGRSYHNAESS